MGADVYTNYYDTWKCPQPPLDVIILVLGSRQEWVIDFLFDRWWPGWRSCVWARLKMMSKWVP